MTNIGANFLKIARHSVDNNILSPKNLIKALQEDLSLSAQDDERDFLTETFLSRPNGERRNFLANVNELRNFREGVNRTNFIQTPEIRMNGVPSPKFLSSL